MQRKSFKDMTCPIATSLEQIGEWWSMLILRDALDGFTRFDEFERNLGIAPNMLTRRLKSLVDAGLLERRQYTTRPPRCEYVITARGKELRTVMVALYAWGTSDLKDEERSVVLVDATTGNEIEPIFVDRTTGRPLAQTKAVFVAGPAASAEMRERLNPDLRAARKRR